MREDEKKAGRMDKVSLIMTTFNSIAHLRMTLESVRQQDYPAIEVAVWDGGSTDGTLEVLQEYEKRPDMDLKWRSGRDRGIYDAMNKGFELATGDIVAFFNDVYSRTDAVRLCVEAMNAQKSDGAHADLVYAEGDRVVRRWRMGQGTLRQGWMPGHPTLFLRRRVYERYGLYKTDYRVAADYEFMVRILKDGDVKLAYVPQTIIRMFYGGVSTRDANGYLTSLKEGHRALKENGVKGAVWIDLKRTIRVLGQFVDKRKTV